MDFLGIGALLNEEERLIQQTVRRWVEDRLLPDIEKWFEEGEFPKEVAGELGALGLLGMHLTGYGCAGASAVSYGLACVELELATAVSGVSCRFRGLLPCFRSGASGSDEQKQQWLPQMAAGEAIGCFGLTEPDAGSTHR